MKRFVLLLVTAALLPAALAAQPAPGAARPHSVRVYPRMGLLSPDTYFYEYFKNFTGDGLTEWTTGYLGRAFVAGVGAEIRLGEGAFVRAEVLRSFDTWLSAAHSLETLRDLYIPPEVVVTWLDVPATLTLTSVQLVLPTRIGWDRVQPYVLAGAGGKLYSFGDPTSPNEVEATLPDDGFTWGGDLGAGLTVHALGLRLDVQARDAWSKYWGKFQHDFVYSGSVSLGIF